MDISTGTGNKSDPPTDSELTGFELETVQFFSDFVHFVGSPRSIGQIYGLLFASEIPLLFSDVVARLGISAGSASQGLKVLVGVGAVRKLDPASGRPASYIPELSLRKLMGGLVRERLQPWLESSDLRLSRLHLAACDFHQVQGSSKVALRKVEQLAKWRTQAVSAIALLQSMFGESSVKIV